MDMDNNDSKVHRGSSGKKRKYLILLLLLSLNYSFPQEIKNQIVECSSILNVEYSKNTEMHFIFFNSNLQFILSMLFAH